MPTRAIIRIMIAHDFYHAGEINHIRVLIQETDRWPYDLPETSEAECWSTWREGSLLHTYATANNRFTQLA